MDKKELIRLIYLYLFSLVGLVLMIIGTVQLIDLGLKKFVFTKADQAIVYPEYPGITAKPTSATVEGETQVVSEEKMKEYENARIKAEEKQRDSQNARTASNAIALLLVGLPLFAYHWTLVQKTKKS